MSEYRVWIPIPGLRLTDEAVWEPFVKDLEERHRELGPVVTWDGPTALQVIVATDAVDEDAAAEIAQRAVAESLRTVGRAELAPADVEVELVGEGE